MPGAPGRTRQRGAALLISIFVLLLLSGLVAGMAVIATGETAATMNFRASTQARFAAEAGLERAVAWLHQTYPTFVAVHDAALYNGACYPVVPAGRACGTAPVRLSGDTEVAANYPVDAVQAAFRTALGSAPIPLGNVPASFSASATLLRRTREIESWEVTVRSIVGFQRATAVVSTSFERVPLVDLPFAIAAVANTCPAVKLTGDTYTDSFDSALGRYGGGNRSLADGDVATNGDIMEEKKANINGVGYVAPSPPNPCYPKAPKKSREKGDRWDELKEPLSYPLPPPPPVMPPDKKQECPKRHPPPGATACPDDTMVPGVYGDLEIDKDVVWKGGNPWKPAVYTVNTLKVKDKKTITVDGSVILHVAGQGKVDKAIDFDERGGFITLSQVAYDLIIFYGGAEKIELSGGEYSAGVIYAPNATVKIKDNEGWVGAILAYKFEAGGKVSVHYDRALRRPFSRTTFTPLGFARSTF